MGGKPREGCPMAATLTASQRRTGDAISDFAGRAAWVYLAAGVLSVLFGGVVLSLVLDWVGLYTVALFVGVFLIAWGVLHIFAALLDQPAHWVWHVIGGALSVFAGALAIGWPDVTLYFVVTLLAAFVIIWGVGDILIAFMLHGAKAKWEREQRAIRRPSSNAGTRPAASRTASARKATARKAPARKAPARTTKRR